jgi:hypothetical protein
MCTTTRMSITFTGPQLSKLRAEADRLGVTVSELVRRIVDQWREHRLTVWPEGLQPRKVDD